MDEWVDDGACVEELMEESMGEWVNRWVDEWMSGCVD